jgi:hypothetical protein
MAASVVDPLVDERWPEFVDEHPRSSVFHDIRWLRALWLTYGYKPLAITTSSPGERLKNALVFCDVRSWLPSRRLVSLPFSDHCDLLTNPHDDHAELLAHLAALVGRAIHYAEIRPSSCDLTSPEHAWRRGESFIHHTLSLDPGLNDLFHQLHKDCIQRKIRKATKEGLGYTKGNSDLLFQQFYGLLLRTRRRHRIPPQPIEWYQNLISCMGDRLTIRIASKDRQPAAAILTLKHKDTITYKYGCSDERLNCFGGMPFLFWMVIQEEKEAGARSLDLGRSEADNSGLIEFKDRLGAVRTHMTYWRCSSAGAKIFGPTWISHLARKLVPRLPSAILHLPRGLLGASGGFFYKHMD